MDRRSSSVAKKNHILKIVMLGDCAVGKTSLIQNYIRKAVSQVYKPTIGADFHSKRLDILDETDGETKSVTLQIWDTAGQERYQSLGRAFYRGAEACILVFDITNRQSFDNIMTWKSEFFEKSLPKDPQLVPIFMLGNKIDLEHERAISKEKIQEFLKQNPDFNYFETSATEGQNVNEVFIQVAQRHLALKKGDDLIMGTPTDVGGKKKFDLDKQKNLQGNKKKCCN